MEWSQFLLVASIHLLAVMSPGPDFVMISRSALVYSRRSAILSAVGLGLGILVHVTYSLLGIALIISQSVLLFTVIKYIGAGYLIYIGYKAIRAKATDSSPAPVHKQKDLSDLASIRLGFLTNALNPKATLFFLALFTQVIHHSTPLWVQLVYGIEMSLATTAWFCFVVILLSHRHIKTRFAKIQVRAERVFGVILIGLGIKVALSTSK